MTKILPYLYIQNIIIRIHVKDSVGIYYEWEVGGRVSEVVRNVSKVGDSVMSCV